MKHLLQQCLEALESIPDFMFFSGSEKIEPAIKAIKEALAKDEQVSSFENSQEPLGEDFSRVLHDNRWDMYVSDESKPKDEQQITRPLREPFIVKQYDADERPIIKGNGFDGLEIGTDREDAQDFIDFVNSKMFSEQKDEQAHSDYVAEIVIEDRDRPFNARTVRAHFRTEIPPIGTKLYTRPAQRQPLSDEEIIEIAKSTRSVEDSNFLPILFARAIENAVYEKMGVK